MVRSCRKFPPNWQNVIPISGVVENTRFVIFKTPVDAKPGLRIRKENQFRTSDLLFRLVQRGQEIGLIINLTFSTRYYDPAIFECITAYKHIACPPAGYIRREDIVKKFISAVDSFLHKHKDDNLLIGIHCSDGINRSGYLVCRYLIDKMHMGSDAALDAFEKARGHTIERGSCIQALHRAVAERRNKEPSPLEHLESDGEKKSRKRKAANPEITQADEMLQQLAMLEQHFSQPTEDSSGPAWQEARAPVPINIGPQAMPKKKKEDFEDGEFLEGDEYFEDDEAFEEADGEPSTAQRRRQRRKKLNRKFNIMKSGKFHLIQEALREE